MSTNSVAGEATVLEKLKEAGKHSIIYGIGSVAQSAAGLLLLPILTGALSKEDFGAYSLIIMISTISSAIFYLGMSSALPRSYYDYKEDSDRRAVFTTAFLILLTGSFLQVTIGVFGSDFVSNLLFDSRRFGRAIYWALVAGALTSINGLLFSYLRMLRKSVSTIVYSLFSLFTSVGLTILLLKVYPDDLRMPFIAVAMAQTIIVLAFFVTDGRNALCLRFLPEELSRLVPYGVASVFASFGAVILEWMDRLYIGHFMTLADVGDYSAVYRVASLMNVLVILPFTQIWSPMMMEYRQHANIKELFSKVLSYFLLAGSMLIVGASMYSSELLGLLINSNISNQMVHIFGIFLLAILTLGALSIVVAGLFYERKISLLVYIYYLVVFVKIMVSYVLVPAYGLAGAAYSAFLCNLILVSIVYFISKRYFSFPINVKRVLGLATLVAVGLYVSEVFRHAGISGLYVRSIFLFVIIVCMVFCAIETKTLRKYARSIGVVG